MDDEILTKEELADYLRISIRTIDRLMKEGMPYLKIRGTVRFEKKKVFSWLEMNKKE